MASLGIEIYLAAQIVGLFGGCAHNVFPAVSVSQKHAIVFAAPALGPIGPVRSHQMKDFPQGHHLIELGHRLLLILIQKEIGALFVNGCLHVFKIRLGFLVFFQNIFHHEGEIFRRCPHGTAAVISQGHIAGT